MCKNHARTYGIELEGYTSENIRDNYVRGWNLIDDGSLNDGREDCDSCGGEGSRDYECRDCDGRGAVECHICSGYGDNRCNSCCGGGEVTCGGCDGSGYTTDDEGNNIECTRCEGSCYETCSDCEGDGRITCETCDGEGSYECDTCSGEGGYTDECNSCYGRGYFGDDDGGYGVECVSGINYEGNYDSIDTIFDYIGQHKYSWFVNEDCGTHVHVGASDLTAIELSKLLILQNIVEPFIYGISPSERIDGSYSKKTDRHTVNMFMALGNRISLQEVADDYYGYNVNINGSFHKYDNHRYFGLNLHSWFYRRSKSSGSTIEFRYFEGCDNREQAKAWIDLCIKLVDFAKYTTFEQLKVIGSDLFMVEDLTEYIVKVKELLSLEYDFKPYNRYAFEESKRNVASCFRSTHVISRAV